MFVCLCHGVSDDQIRNLVESGVTSVREIRKNCKAGSDCGACICHLRKLIKETAADDTDAFNQAQEA